jgi:ComEC/Rec2-related protein
LGEWFEVPLGLIFAASFLLLGGLGLAIAVEHLGAVDAAESAAAPRTATALLAGLLVGAGWLNHVRHQTILSSRDLRVIAGDTASLAEVRGVLITTPERRAVETDSGLKWKSRATIELESIRLRDVWMATSGRVRATVGESLNPRYHRGARVLVSGVLKPPQTALGPGLFDYRSYLARRGIHYLLITEAAHDWTTIEDESKTSLPRSDCFMHWARKTLALGLPDEDEALRLRWAMLLGWRGVLTSEARSPFLHSGTMHVFAISGLHVSLVTSILVAFLRLLRVPRGWSGLLLIPTLWAYADLTGWQPSAVRATVMMSVIIAGWALRRPADLLNSLAGAALLILIWDPRQLFQPGFQLSFGVVLSLATLLPVIQRWGGRWSEPEPWLPASLRPPLRERLRPWMRKGITGLGVSLAAWLGSMPLVAWYFNLVTPVSVLVNLAIVPLAWVVILSGLCSLACGAWWVWAAECFNHSGWLAMRLMMSLSAQAAEWPGAWWPLTRPSPWFMVGYYALLIWPLSRDWSQRCRVGWAGLAGLLLVAGLLVPFLQRRNSLELIVLPVEQGDSLWVDFPARAQDTLIDTSDEQALNWLVGPFLRGQGRRDVPRLILSHGDVRHVGGVPRLLEGFAVGEVWISPFNARSRAYREGVNLLENQAHSVAAVRRGTHQQSWRVLHPSSDDPFTRADDQALVLLLEWEGARILLCSDLGRRGQSRLIEREPDLRVDAIVAGMPSVGERPLSPFFLQSLQPQVIVLSTAGAQGRQEASRTLYLRLVRLAVPVFRTGKQGAVVIRVQEDRIEVKAMDGTQMSLQPRRVELNLEDRDAMTQRRKRRAGPPPILDIMR